MPVCSVLGTGQAWAGAELRRVTSLPAVGAGRGRTPLQLKTGYPTSGRHTAPLAYKIVINLLPNLVPLRPAAATTERSRVTSPVLHSLSHVGTAV